MYFGTDCIISFFYQADRQGAGSTNRTLWESLGAAGHPHVYASTFYCWLDQAGGSDRLLCLRYSNESALLLLIAFGIFPV